MRSRLRGARPDLALPDHAPPPPPATPGLSRAETAHSCRQQLPVLRLQNSRPMFISAVEDCEYTFTWPTPAACPVKRMEHGDCQVTNPATGEAPPLGSRSREAWCDAGSSVPSRVCIGPSPPEAVWSAGSWFPLCAEETDMSLEAMLPVTSVSEAARPTHLGLQSWLQSVSLSPLSSRGMIRRAPVTVCPGVPGRQLE